MLYSVSEGQNGHSEGGYDPWHEMPLVGKDEDWEVTTGMIEREIALAGEFGGRV